MGWNARRTTTRAARGVSGYPTQDERCLLPQNSQSAKYPVRDWLCGAGEYRLEVDEALDFQCGASAVGCYPDYDPEGENEWRGVVVGFRLPRLPRDIGGRNDRTELGPNRSAVDLGRGVVQLSRTVQKAHVSGWFPVGLCYCARYQRLAEVRSDDRRAGRELGIVFQAATRQRNLLIGKEYY